MTTPEQPPHYPAGQPERRRFLKAAAGLSALSLLPRTLAQAATTAASPVSAGDLLVYPDGPKAKQPIKLADLKEGVAVPAVAMDPASKALRDPAKGGVVLVKLKPDQIKASSKPNAAGGVVAYSSVCTHQGCPAKELGTLGSGKGRIICTCHGSQYDPGDNATVLGGPAPRRLPALPLKTSAAGELVAAAGFTGRVGPGK